MTCHDVIVNRKLTLDEITFGLCKGFSMKSSEILVVDDISKADVIENLKVICERQEISGQFPMILSIYVHDKQLARYDETQTIGRFCEITNCTCLISDDSINPYSWIFVNNCREYKSVFLVASRLDEHDEYIISRLQDAVGQETMPGDLPTVTKS
jgi:hypothetical protein